MEKKRFIPFDEETFLMIEDITGTEPEVTEKENYFKLKMYAPDKEERIIEAAIYAVQDRYRKRIKDVRSIKEQNLLRGAIFFVEYEKGAENLPNELRTNLGMPDETAGDIYCRRLLEVRALPVKRDNWEKLQIFTGGGTMQIPRTPGGLAVYSFPTENGVMLDVPEGNFIVLAPDGKFGKMDMQTFMANFEEKDANTAGLNFDEKRLFEKMNKLFGRNIEKRLGKLAEEYNELFEAFERYLSREKTQREINEINPGTHDIIDELADVNVVLFHIAALLGYSQKELQEMAYTKIAGREKNPEFMRKHPHNKPESPVCGNMQQETAEQYNILRTVLTKDYDKRRKEELRKKALFLTNTAYLLADMAHTCVFYADDKLNHLGKCFEKGEKMRFKKAAKLTKEALKAVKEITEPLYNITDVDNACIDSDYLLEVIQLVINRTDETEESKTAMLEYIKKLPQIEHIEV